MAPVAPGDDAIRREITARLAGLTGDALRLLLVWVAIAEREQRERP